LSNSTILTFIFESVYGVGKEEEAKVVRIIEKGIIVELSLGVDGFVPASQLSTSKVKNLSLCFPVDSKIKVRIVEFDKDNKKIVLSALAALKDKADDEIEEYIAEHKLEKVTAEDIRSADSGKFDSSAFVGFNESAAKKVAKQEEKQSETSQDKSVDQEEDVKKDEIKEEEVKVEEKTEEVSEDVKSEETDTEEEEKKSEEMTEEEEEEKSETEDSSKTEDK
jgi:small subunit ribosomal protein S1